MVGRHHALRDRHHTVGRTGRYLRARGASCAFCEKEACPPLLDLAPCPRPPRRHLLPECHPAQLPTLAPATRSARPSGTTATRRRPCSRLARPRPTATPARRCSGLRTPRGSGTTSTPAARQTRRRGRLEGNAQAGPPDEGPVLRALSVADLAPFEDIPGCLALPFPTSEPVLLAHRGAGGGHGRGAHVP